MQTLWNQFRYKAPIRCLIDVSIREYDITKANISILRDQNLIDDGTYKALYSADKLSREVYIGNLISRRPNYSTAISEGIKLAKKRFFEMNGIQDEEILEIDNDAVFILGSRHIFHQQVSSNVYFRLDQSFTSFYDVNHIRFYYYLNRIQNVENMVAKGLGQQGTQLHSRYILDFLKELFYTAQVDGIKAAIELLSGFYKNYISKKLDIEYYRELNPDSRYAIRIANKIYSAYATTDAVTASLRSCLDISHNEIILREFNRLLFYEYTKGKR